MIELRKKFRKHRITPTTLKAGKDVEQHLYAAGRNAKCYTQLFWKTVWSNDGNMCDGTMWCALCHRGVLGMHGRQSNTT